MPEWLVTLLGKLIDKIRWPARTGPAGQLEHDRQKFRDLDAVLPEGHFHALIEQASQQVMDPEMLELAETYLRWAWQPGNAFISRRLQTRRRSFDDALGEFFRFLGNNMDYATITSRRLSFLPDYNPARGVLSADRWTYYEAQTAKLRILAERALATYQDFRAECKKKLLV